MAGLDVVECVRAWEEGVDSMECVDGERLVGYIGEGEAGLVNGWGRVEGKEMSRGWIDFDGCKCNGKLRGELRRKAFVRVM